MLVIDESPMISNDLLFNIYLRLVEIFGCQGWRFFIQLSSIQPRPVYMNFRDN